MGPLSTYLFRAFSDAMLSQLDDDVRREVVMQANELVASGEFFETAKQTSQLSDDSVTACEPDMKGALQSSMSLDIRPDLVLTRRSFFVAVRRLARIIKTHDPAFDLTRDPG